MFCSGFDGFGGALGVCGCISGVMIGVCWV